MIQLAVLEDDAFHLKLIQKALQNPGAELIPAMQCTYFDNGTALLASLKTTIFDVVILDRQVADISGDEILQWIRTHGEVQTLVLMLTSLSGAQEIAKLLNAGAYDYITKPFQEVELLARIRRLLIRRGGSQTDHPTSIGAPYAQFELFGFLMDRMNLSITLPTGVELKMTEREFSLVEFLLRNEGQALSRAQIFEGVWKRSFVGSSRAVDALVHRVRGKLGLAPELGFVLRQIYGFGYRLDVLNQAGTTS